MHVLLTHRYFWPDAPAYAQMLKIMADRFVAEGHQVTVLSTQPGYNAIYQGNRLPRREVVGGMEVRRIALLQENKKNPVVRAANVLIYCCRLFFHILSHPFRYDLVTVASFPPTVAALTVRLACMLTRTKYLYHCQDLYPEVALSSGLIEESILSRMAAKIDAANCRCAAAVVVLSNDMLCTVQRRGVSDDEVHVINNFIIDELDVEAQLPAALQCPDNAFRLLFAGNLGRFQSLAQVVEAALLLTEETDIQLMFVGAGVMLERLIDQAGDAAGKSIIFVEHQPLPTVLRIIQESQLSLISLASGVVYTAYPSKTMSYLEGGSRVLAILEEESELAKFVVENDLGAVCGSTDPRQIADAILEQRDRWRREGHDPEAVRRTAREYFSQDVILQKWCQLLNQLAD